MGQVSEQDSHRGQEGTAAWKCGVEVACQKLADSS